MALVEARPIRGGIDIDIVRRTLRVDPPECIILDSEAIAFEFSKLEGGVAG